MRLHNFSWCIVCTFIILPLYGLMPGFVLHAQQFEGSLTYKVEADGANHDFVYHMKEDHARVEISSEEMGGQIVILIDTDKENMTVLMEQLNIYMDIPIPRNNDSAQTEQGDEFHLTGEKKTIADYECQQYIYTDEDGAETEVWTPIDNNFGSFFFPEFGNDSMGTMKQPEVPSFSFFPFLIVSQANGEQVRMEVVSVEEKELADDLFTVPSGYREMNIPLFGN